MRVLKFGGSSVATAKRITNIGEILKNYHQRNEPFALVFSAFGGVTNLLVNMSRLAARGKLEYLELLSDFKVRHIKEAKLLVPDSAIGILLKQLKENHKTLKQLLKGIYLVREASPRTIDYVLSFGERNSCLIITEFLKHLGLNANYLDAREIIKTDKSFGAAKVNFETTYPLIKNWVNSHKGEIPVITGFIAADIGGLTTTLGRGGSDYTAAIVAGAIKAKSLEIWTDVDGVLTCDPRKVKHAYTIKNLSFNEAMELSHFGAKVIYPPTIQPALSESIPIYIKNSFNPEFKGTRICKEISPNDKSGIKGISSISDVALLTVQGSGMLGVPGTAGRLFKTLAKAQINIIMITQGSSEHSICIAINKNQVNIAKNLIENEFTPEMKNKLIYPLEIENNLSIIAVVGEKMKKLPGVSGKLFQALGRNGINVNAIAQGSSELNISFAIESKNEIKALNLIHDSFFLSDDKSINLFIVGVGLVGSTLLSQISRQKDGLKKTRHLNFKVVGIANSKRMIFNRNGVGLKNWKENLEKSKITGNISSFINEMKSMNMPNSVFIDNTANVEVASHYLNILDSSISISTPNKIAASSKFEQYLSLKQKALQRNVQFLYETNVGAGLPIISTLQGLVSSGDQILKIEAVLSGSLSYIFNHFKPGVSFRNIVEMAKKKGFTEPDPREDLSGRDIQRKIIILAREAGFKLELEDVVVENILPESCYEAESVEEFLQDLDHHASYFENLISEAHAKNSVLRYIAKLEDGKASVELKMVKDGNPFYHLHESDNMIAFLTERYNTRPLIIRGPGAGSEVTAAGVFSEIITLGSAHYFGYN